MSDLEGAAADGADTGQQAGDSHEELETLNAQVSEALESCAKQARIFCANSAGLSNSLDEMFTDLLKPNDLDKANKQLANIEAAVAPLRRGFLALSARVEERITVQAKIDAAAAKAKADAAAAKAFRKANAVHLHELQETVKRGLLTGSGTDPIFSAKMIDERIKELSAKNATKDLIEKQAAKFHDALALFLPTAIVARMGAEIERQNAQANSDPDEIVSVQPLFQEDTTEGYVAFLLKQQVVNSHSDKQNFITGVNILIGYAVVNDSLRKTPDPSASESTPTKRSPGNAKSLERHNEIARLVETLKEAGHNVAHNDVKGKLATGELWRSCIEPYSKGVWSVLPVYEFFDALGMTRNRQYVHGRISRAHIKTLFECIKETKTLYDYLVEACNDPEAFVKNNLRDEEGFLLGGNYILGDEISWIHDSCMVPRDGSVGNMSLNQLHDCAGLFKRDYVTGDFRDFIEGCVWSELITLLVLGVSEVCGIEPKYTFSCLSMDSSNNAKIWNASRLWSHEQAKVDFLVGFFLDKNRKDGEEQMVLVLFRPGHKRRADGSPRWTIYILGAESHADNVWLQRLGDLFPSKTDSSQTTMGDAENYSLVYKTFSDERPGLCGHTVRDYTTIHRVLDTVATIFTGRTLQSDLHEKERSDMSVITKVMQRLMVKGLIRAANHQAQV